MIHRIIKNYFDLFIPTYAKYILWTSEQKCGFFKEINQEDYDKFEKARITNKNDYSLATA